MNDERVSVSHGNIVIPILVTLLSLYVVGASSYLTILRLHPRLTSMDFAATGLGKCM